ncbi:hypothetical protein LSH36_1g25006 [Paralvinella palmiformis]|uniref:inositol-1,3,4-trisphosphate 5/6-kinase n=1 Tax=Paralvinella palmiformis TaxID=53620 RepID=A0AAD9KGM0_9ANNE|nr:hypothetical protein LSH36_1g25006 [Paralvinella palmiformis]
MDRHYTYQFVKECEVLEKEYQYFMPNFVEFNCTDIETNKLLMEQNGVQFPFICKPTVAHGSSQCHQMAIIFNEKGLKDVEPPCVAQTFINHNAVLYKIFVIGKKHFVVPRPSLKNFFAGNYKTIHFDSACVSKPHSCTFLNMLDEDDMYNSPKVEPDMDCLENLARGLQGKLGLDLIGVDVIIENKTGRYAVVDINAFPGYENGIDDLYGCLLTVFLETLERHRGRSDQESVLISHNRSVSNSVPTLTGSSERPVIPGDKSLLSDVTRMNEKLYSFHLNDGCDCSLKKEASENKDQFFLCNHLYTETCQNDSRTAVNDSSVWNEMLIEENNTTNTSSRPCRHSTWSVD